MKITVEGRGPGLREKLRPRLDLAATLRCSEHGLPPLAVIINDRENGWFDSRWTTCCDGLKQQAVAIVKNRC